MKRSEVIARLMFEFTCTKGFATEVLDFVEYNLGMSPPFNRSMYQSNRSELYHGRQWDTENDDTE